MSTSQEMSSWGEYKSRLEKYFALTWERRSQLIFRGQADNRWELKTSLDRYETFDSDAVRQRYRESLIREFRREAAGLIRTTVGLYSEADWELLGRHHGLPTTILDWTTSPYIAAFFAFDDEHAAESDFVSIWVIDRDAFRDRKVPEVGIIDDEEAIRFNPRAIEQRGLFLRLDSIEKPIEQLLPPDALFRYDVPSRDREIALVDLDEMLINARTLFRNLDGAAKTAAMRVQLFGRV